MDVTGSHRDPHFDSALYEAPADLLCWSRMQAEAGQHLPSIIARKEQERRAGGGLFFWGVGNAPALIVNSIARSRQPVPVIFSIMKGKPKAEDVDPDQILVWRKYVDLHGVERNLPPHALITSRARTAASQKARHYALMCHSAGELKLTYGTSFDPNAYCNAGGTGAPVGSSQVTALVRRFGVPGADTGYEANLRAELAGSYWVRLSDPVVAPTCRLREVDAVSVDRIQGWLALVETMREGPSAEQQGAQPRLL